MAPERQIAPKPRVVLESQMAPERGQAVAGARLAPLRSFRRAHQRQSVYSPFCRAKGRPGNLGGLVNPRALARGDGPGEVLPFPPAVELQSHLVLDPTGDDIANLC